MTGLIQQLYKNARTKILGSNDYSEWFEAIVGVRQGCILSPILFNLFLERIMTDALDGFSDGVKCGGLAINNIRFADYIDLLADSK